MVIRAGAPPDYRLPAYPVDARYKGEQGDVLVEIELTPSGAVRSARVKQSSGHSSLDTAALRSASRLRFRPPQPPPGVVLHNAIVVEIPFSFRLD
jgi:protein TonB